MARLALRPLQSVVLCLGPCVSGGSAWAGGGLPVRGVLCGEPGQMLGNVTGPQRTDAPAARGLGRGLADGPLRGLPHSGFAPGQFLRQELTEQAFTDHGMRSFPPGYAAGGSHSCWIGGRQRRAS